MKNRNLKQLLNMKRLAATAVVSLACLGLGVTTYQANLISNLESYSIADQFETAEGDTVQVEDEATPTAKPVVTTKTSTKTSTKYVIMDKAATKNSSSSKTTTTVSNGEKTEGNKNIKTKKTVKKTVTTALKKKSTKKTITTKVETTVQTTTTKVSASASATGGKIEIEKLCPKADENVLQAYNIMNFTTTVKSNVSYGGYFNARSQSITLRTADKDNAYHELGHFVAFAAGNVDRKDAFEAIYKAEKSKYKGRNSSYVLEDAEEYFAESYRQYVLGCDNIENLRPKTYAYIQDAVEKITEARAKSYYQAYKSSGYWK